MKSVNAVVFAFLCLGLSLSACAPTSGSDPPSSNQSRATAVIPVTPMSGTYVVASDVAVARTSPSLDADILTSFKAGDVVQVNGLAGAETWYRVVTDKGEGWVAVSFLAEQPEETEVPHAPRPPTAPQPSATTSHREPTPIASLTPTTCAGAPADWVQYWVQPGDTLASLATATGTTVASLRQSNCMAPDDNTIYAGQPLWVPRLPPPTAPPPDTPTVTVTATPPFQPPPRVLPTETRRAAP